MAPFDLVIYIVANETFANNSVVPEETQLFVHTYSIHRDPRNFSNPEAFLPERWLEHGSPDPSIIVGEHPLNAVPDKRSSFPQHNTSAFMPFSHGPRMCVGKNLALMEMRMLVTWILSRFDLQPTEGSALEQWEATLEDWFVLTRGTLPARVTVR